MVKVIVSIDTQIPELIIRYIGIFKSNSQDAILDDANSSLNSGLFPVGLCRGNLQVNASAFSPGSEFFTALPACRIATHVQRLSEVLDPIAAQSLNKCFSGD